MKIQKVLDHFYQDLNFRRVSRHTIKAYKLDLVDFGNHILEQSGKSTVDEINLFEEVVNCTSRDFQTFLEYLGQSAPSTIARKFSSLRYFLAWAQKNSYRKRPAPDLPMRMPKQQKLAPRWLTKSQVDMLIRKAEKFDHSQNQRNVVIIKLLLNTGLRVSELVTLEWDDIILKRYEGTIKVISGKGGKERFIPLNANIRSTLEKYKLYMDKHYKNESHLFHGKRGRLKEDAILRIFYSIGKVLDFKITPHVLRHTFCKTLLNKDVKMNEIADLAGHSSLTTTQKYVTPSLSDLSISVEKLNDW
jgi:site-specific recombinase XerD